MAHFRVGSADSPVRAGQPNNLKPGMLIQKLDKALPNCPCSTQHCYRYSLIAQGLFSRSRNWKIKPILPQIIRDAFQLFVLLKIKKAALADRPGRT
jgi:hypothetical protein